MDRHLSENEIEALAHQRDELVPEEALTHLAVCDACAADVSVTRALSQNLGLQLREQLGTVDFAVDDLVSAVLSASDGARAQTQLGTPAPARGTLLVGLLGGLVVALTTGTLSRPGLPSRLPSLGSAYELLRAARCVMGAVDEQIVSRLPGGWGLVMVCAWLLLAAFVMPARVLLSRARVRTPSLFTSALMALALFLISLPVRALDVEGVLPEQKRVSLSVVREPTSKVLGRIADAAGLGLVITLPDDPLVSVRVKKATLREVLTAVLGEQAVTVRLEGTMLIVRPATSQVRPPTPPASGRDANSELDDVPMVTAPAPTVTPGPSLPGLPAPPAPPGLPKPPGSSGKRVSDRVVMGGNNTIPKGERVRDAIVVGGNLTVYGVVEGDAVAVGGHVRLMPGSEVKGELLAVGGAVTQEKGAVVRGDADSDDDEDDDDEAEEKLEAKAEAIAAKAEARAAKAEAKAEAKAAKAEAKAEQAAEADQDDDDDEATLVIGGHRVNADDRDDDDDDDEPEKEDSWLEQTLKSASRHALLFVLGLVLLGVWPRRLDALERTMTRAPLRTGALGVLGLLGAAVLCLLLVITILGIPAAIVLALGAALAMYAGLAATAFAVGKALPIPRIAKSPVLQLGAGVLILFLLARIPVFNMVVFAVACALGLGAIVRTRFAEQAPGDEGPTPGDQGPTSGDGDQDALAPIEPAPL